MAVPTNTLLIEGSFEELANELAAFIDEQKKDGGENVQPEVEKLVKEGNKEDALKKLVVSSVVLNNAPEKSVIPAYNLLLHIARQVPKPEKFFAKICDNLSQPFASQQHGSGLALTILSTMFNIIPPTHDTRFHVLLAIVKVTRQSGSYDSLRPQLENLERWLEEWEIDEEDQRRLYKAVSEAASEAGEDEESYKYQKRALQTFTADDASSDEARRLAVATLKVALESPTHYDFQDITGLDAIQALRSSDTVHFQLLEIFTSEQLEEFNDFKDEHDGWIDSQSLNKSALDRKMRLLTLASEASKAPNRELTYERIAKALQIPEDEVELWVIDVIRAGLVEGKLSQLNKVFLIHRSTYRVFGENQWREVAARLDMWKGSLSGVLSIIRQERENLVQAREQERKDAEAKANGQGERGDRGGFRGRGGRDGQYRKQDREPVNQDAD